MATARPPRRHLPLERVPGLGLDLVAGRERSFLADCQAMLRRCAWTWEDTEAIPVTGPVCLVVNHYQRADLWIGWTGALVSCAVASRRGRTPRWLVTGNLHLNFRGRLIPFPGAHWAFQRVSHAWGMVPTPDLVDSPARAAALRQLCRLVVAGEAIGLFPEGPKGRAGANGPALPGIGRFLALLARRQVPVIAVGIREEGDRLVARFGPPLVGLAEVGRAGESDALIGSLIMEQIASLAGPKQSCQSSESSPSRC